MKKNVSSKEITQFHEISNISLIFCVPYFPINHLRNGIPITNVHKPKLMKMFSLSQKCIFLGSLRAVSKIQVRFGTPCK